MKLKVADILVDDTFNCRGEFSPESVQELAASLNAEGLINPVSVMINPRPCGHRWMLIAGHRRIAAARLLGWEEIEAILHESMTERDAHRINLQENMGRRDLRPSHEMRAIVAIYGPNPNLDQVAEELGKSKKWVRDRLNIRDLDKRIVESVDEGLLGALDIQLISSAMPGEQWDIARMLVEKKAKGFSTKEVARSLKLRRKRRTLREMKEARELLLDYRRSPSWLDTLAWCAGELPSEDFFDLTLDTLKKWGILE